MPVAGVLEPFDGCVGSSVLRPTGQEADGNRGAAGIRVDVQGDVHSIRLRLVDERHVLLDLARSLGVRAEVGEVVLHAGAPSDLQHLRNASTAEGAFRVGASRLGHVHASEVANQLAYLDQFVGARPWPRVVARSCGEANRALIHALTHEVLVSRHQVSDERNVSETRGLKPNGSVRHEVCGVDGHFLMVVRPKCIDTAHVEVFRRLAEKPLQPAAVGQVVVVRQGGVRHAVNTQKFGRDALPQPAGVLRVDEQIAFGVGMRVNESR